VTLTTKVASILAEIGIDSSKFTQGAKGVLGGIGDMIGGFGKMSGVIGGAVAAIGFIVSEMQKMEQAAVASNKEGAKMTAILESTKYAAGLSKDELMALNQEISKSAGLDDELVSAGQSVMLTFTKIGKEVFPRAMQSAADMAAVLGGDLQGKVTMIGKAMNDFSGYTALKRAGVVFSEEQERQIKNFKSSNDLISYQKLILNELATEYGGAAKAINDAGDGSENLKIAQENLAEAVGQRMIPAQKEQNKWLTELIEKQTAVVELHNQEAAAMQELGIFYSNQTGYMKDNVSMSWNEAEAAIAAQVALDKQAVSIEQVGVNAGLTTEELADLQKISKASADELTKSFRALNNEMIYNALAANLDESGQRELARQLGLLNENTYNALNQIDALTGKFDLNKNGIIDLTERTKEYYAALKKVTDTSGDYTWNFIVNSSSVMAPTSFAQANQQTTKPKVTTNNSSAFNATAQSYVNQYRASGGPSSGLTWVGEQGPELLDLPGGSYVNNNNVSKNMANVTQTPVITDDQLKTLAKLTQTDWTAVGYILQNAVMVGMQTR
jgi:hypothetical protein